jgi:methionyl-tRNA formyltransferase
MSEMGAGLVVDSLRKLDRGEIFPRPQETANASYAPILKKEDGRIDWTRTAQQIYNRMRGFMPWPGAFTTFRGQACHLWGRPGHSAASEGRNSPGEIVASTKDISVVCGEGTGLRLEAVQLEGRKRVSAREFANGARLKEMERFASD